MENSTVYPTSPTFDDPSQNVFTAAYTSISDDEDSSNEWEYEYSTTESETYYLTLDLSTPEVPPAHLTFDETVRKKTRWLNPSIGRHRRQTPMPPASRTAKTYTLDGRGFLAETEQPEKASEDEEEAFQPLATQNEPTKESNSVQILNLESHHPVVAYDGHVYACNWAENIGTELIFTPHEDDINSLPKLRTLRGNVDLLASCSARLVAKSMKLTPLEDSRTAAAKPRGRNKVLIPVGHAASQQRKDQALFLEKLVLAKEKRGELDSVTINAKPRLPPRKIRALFEEKRSQLKADLRKNLKRKAICFEEKESARKRLDVMNKEEFEWTGRGDGLPKAGRNGGRPKKVSLVDNKMRKSTLWSQRNVKGKGKAVEIEASSPSQTPGSREGSYVENKTSDTSNAITVGLKNNTEKNHDDDSIETPSAINQHPYKANETRSEDEDIPADDEIDSDQI